MTGFVRAPRTNYNRGYYKNGQQFIQPNSKGFKKRFNCEMCGIEYDAKPHESNQTKRLCKDCRYKAERKTCELCGNVFRKSKRQAFTQFNARRYCSRSCSKKAMWANRKSDCNEE